MQLFTHTSQLPAGWDVLLPSHHFLQSQQLILYEQVHFPDVTFLYALISVHAKPVAAAYFQVLQIKSGHLDTARLKPLQAAAWKTFTASLRPKLLVAGNLFRHDVESFYFQSAMAPFEAFRCYQAAIRKAMASSCAMAAMVKDMSVTLTPYFQHYAPQYLLLRNDISMEMSIPDVWQTFDDYEKALKHKYAQRLRKVRQPWDQLEITPLSEQEAVQQKETLFNLYKQVSTRQQVRLGMLSAEYLPALKQQYPHQLHIWLARVQGTPVAFFSAWLQQDVFDMFYIGFDYSRNDDLQLYFNILYFSIEQAINHRKQTLILGRTALEAKARLGCKPRYLSTYLYIRNPLLRSVILRLQQSITTQEGEWENRHPFKK